MSINIIQAIQDKGFFYDYLVGNANSMQSWSHWQTLLRVIYGLDIRKKSALELIKLCTGRNPDKLSPNGYNTALLLVGRRGGKSKVAGLIAAFEAALSNREDVLSAGELGLVSVISPTRFQSQIVKSYIRACFDSPLLSEEITQEDREGFELSNGIRVQILTGDYKAVRGFSQLAVVIEEINFFCISEESKVRNATSLVNSIRPSLATTRGKCIAISTKYRKNGWGYNTWKRCFKNDDAKTLVWEAPSRLMNPKLSQDVIDEAILEDRSSANSEYLNEWREDLELFLPQEVIQSCVIPGRKQLLPNLQKYSYFGFVDCSGGRHDSAALAIAHLRDDKTGKGNVVIDLLKQYKSPHSPVDVVERQASELKKFGLYKVVGDFYSAQWVVDAFQSNGIKYEKSKLNKSQLFLEVLPRLCSPNGIELLDDDLTVKQFANLERKVKAGGRDTIGHPSGSGFHDDVANVIAGCSYISSEKKKRAGVFL